jgi:hypothetical protein
MKTVLSWDIGLKNLSYCILENKKEKNKEDKEEEYQTETIHGYCIKDWGLINVYENQKEIINYCNEKTKKGTICHKKAKFTNIDENVFFCKKHSQKDSKLISKKSKPKKKYSPFDYAIRIKNILDKHPNFKKVKHVVIENQPCQLNPTMKSVQMILFSYFTFLHSSGESDILSVSLVNAKQKEKLPLEDNTWINSEFDKKAKEKMNRVKDSYKKRKILCVEYTKYCLQDAPEYLSFLENHEKQDDLSDCFLQAQVWFSHNKLHV